MPDHYNRINTLFFKFSMKNILILLLFTRPGISVRTMLGSGISVSSKRIELTDMEGLPYSYPINLNTKLSISMQTSIAKLKSVA
nr:unnamed protein product [Callosobruchus analis]CAI5858829.1 unnamed protein product [Callosobruchus analis]